jgi:hypothetical protein
MQLVVSVVSGDRRSTFKVPVGDGRKSFKWLALVAAQRFGSESPKGKLRQREVVWKSRPRREAASVTAPMTTQARAQVPLHEPREHQFSTVAMLHS